MRPYLENIQTKSARRMAQVVESLLSKCEGLSFKPHYHQERKIEKIEIILVHSLIIAELN
jgi:hypothetical protein